MPGREQVQVLHISIFLGCTQHCQATLKSSKNYAYIQEEIKQTTGG